MEVEKETIEVQEETAGLEL